MFAISLGLLPCRPRFLDQLLDFKKKPKSLHVSSQIASR
jgi:hypothetical protein